MRNRTVLKSQDAEWNYRDARGAYIDGGLDLGPGSVEGLQAELLVQQLGVLILHISVAVPLIRRFGVGGGWE
jgi:hypothetical protein